MTLKWNNLNFHMKCFPLNTKKKKNNSANRIYGQTTPVTPLVKQLKPTRQELFHISKWKLKYHQ